MTRCLSVLECGSIQSYIFASNRLSEAIGGSELVKQATEAELELALSTYLSRYQLDWQAQAQLQILQAGSDLQGEIWYSGGGNAVIVFDSLETAQGLVRYWSSCLLAVAPGLNLLAAHQVFDETNSHALAPALKAAFAEQGKLKERAWANSRREGLSINRPCDTTGRAAAIKYDTPEETWLAAAAAARRANADSANRTLKSNYRGLLGSHYDFPLDLDYLSNQEGQSRIAVVHIDGNAIGRRLLNLLQGNEDNQTLVDKVRRFSKSITQAGQTAFDRMLADLNFALEGLQEQVNGLQLKRQNDKTYFPLRPLILGGDDLTFVCEGRLGLPLAARYLEYFSEQADSQGRRLSACAGVVIARSHFPLARAYRLADQLCSNAKNLRRSKDNENDTGWLDFQIIFSGTSGDLERLRQQTSELYWRPWRVTDKAPDNRDAYSWQNFREILLHFQSENWARTQVKGLREAVAAGEDATKTFLSQARLRGYNIPDSVVNFYSQSQSGWLSEKSFLYDSMEALDFYLEIEQSNANKN